jgi:hypothetical protein
VRINIPNPHGVYMHDTPAKGIFGDDFRFVSSGCVVGPVDRDRCHRAGIDPLAALDDRLDRLRVALRRQHPEPARRLHARHAGQGHLRRRLPLRVVGLRARRILAEAVAGRLVGVPVDLVGRDLAVAAEDADLVDIPNPHGVYMHDTPAKGIFGDDFRFVSSGCVRVPTPGSWRKR